MAEKLDLTSAITAPSVTDYRVSRLLLDWDGARIAVGLKGPNGELRTEGYTGAAATNLMVTLNKANLSTTSLHKRVLNQLVADGKLPAGTVSGTPD